MGKASYVAGIALLVLGAIGLRGEASGLILAILAVLVFSLYFGGALWFAHRHPGEAMLEGAELIKWRQMEIAAKDTTITPALTIQTEPPAAIAHNSGEGDAG